MAKDCPYGGKALYTDCLECEDKLCKNKSIACIGIDQSYKRTGISISVDGKIKLISSIDLHKIKTKTEKRIAVKNHLQKVINVCRRKGIKEIYCIYERVRLRSQGFLSMNYIQSISGLNATIIDTCFENNIPVFSVDTRCWKAQVIGTSKPQNNKYGVSPEKWPTVKWVIKQGRRKDILLEVQGRRKSGTFIKGNKKYEYNDDAADSAAISMFWFTGKHEKLRPES